MIKKATPDTIDDIITENAWLHQTAMMQRTIQAGTNAELLRLNEVNKSLVDINNSLRRIVAYILMQNNNSYRITRKTLMAGYNFAGDIGLEIDPITDDWNIILNDVKHEKEN